MAIGIMEMNALAAIVQRNICIAVPIASDRGCQCLPSAPGKHRSDVHRDLFLTDAFDLDQALGRRGAGDREHMSTMNDDGRSWEAAYLVVAGFFIIGGGTCLVTGPVAVVACAGRYLATIAGSICAMLLSGRRVQVSSLPNSEMPR